MKVFLSFAQPDHRLIHVLSGALTEAGITPLVAAQRLSPGRRLEDKVRDMIAEADCLVVLNTVHGAKSRWVQQEIGCAKALCRGFPSRSIPVYVAT
jgi:TIR domain